MIPANLVEKRAERDRGIRRKTEKDIQEEMGGAGVYSADLKKKYLLEDEDWRYDVMPEIWDGHNIADFVDPVNCWHGGALLFSGRACFPSPASWLATPWPGMPMADRATICPAHRTSTPSSRRWSARRRSSKRSGRTTSRSTPRTGTSTPTTRPSSRRSGRARRPS